MSTTKRKGQYKLTGNIAVDMVAACIYHCERHQKKIKFIALDAIHWTMFKGFVLEKIPMYDLSDGNIEFDGVIVKQGSFLQTKQLYYEVEKEHSKTFSMN